MTTVSAGGRIVHSISIHIPRVGDDEFARFNGMHMTISIHIPRVGDD